MILKKFDICDSIVIESHKPDLIFRADEYAMGSPNTLFVITNNTGYCLNKKYQEDNNELEKWDAFSTSIKKAISKLKDRDDMRVYLGCGNEVIFGKKLYSIYKKIKEKNSKELNISIFKTILETYYKINMEQVFHISHN